MRSRSAGLLDDIWNAVASDLGLLGLPLGIVGLTVSAATFGVWFGLGSSHPGRRPATAAVAPLRWHPVIVRIDPASPVPPFEQLRAQVAASIAAGQLPPGHQLPPIRQLASDLDLAPGTVARAYRELEASGLVVSRGRRGTRVADEQPAVDAAQLAGQREAAARAYATTLRQLGVSVDDGVAALRRELDAEPAVS